MNDDRLLTERLDTANGVAARLLEDGEASGVIIAGSLPAGLGNSTSDIDLFAFADGTENSTQQVRIDNARVDIEWYDESTVLRDFRALLSTSLNWKGIISLWPQDDTIDLAFRIHTGIVKADSKLLIDREVQNNIDRLRQIALSKWALIVNTHLSDYLGVQRKGDLRSTALVGQTLLASAGKAVTSAAGDYYYGRKWVYAQLGRSALPLFDGEGFWSAQSGAWASQTNVDVDAPLRLAQSLVSGALLCGWDDTGMSVWPSAKVDTVGPLRSPDWSFFRTDSGFLLHKELRGNLALGQVPALIWALSEGGDETVVAKSAQNVAESLGWSTGIGTRRVVEVWRSLLDRGAMVRAQERFQ